MKLHPLFIHFTMKSYKINENIPAFEIATVLPQLVLFSFPINI